MKHTIWLFDGTYEVVDDTAYANGIAEVEDAMINKKAVYLGRKLVAGSAISKIEPFGNTEYGVKDYVPLASGFEQAAQLMEGRTYTPTKRDEAQAKITELLKKLGGSNQAAREYVANRNLAMKLHDTKDWTMHDWDQFIASHPNPERELVELELLGDE